MTVSTQHILLEEERLEPAGG